MNAACKTFSCWADNVYVQRKEQTRLFQVDRKRMGGNRMAEKQKLIDLLEGFSFPVTVNGEMLSEWTIPMPQIRKALADHLLANGVTFATDTNVGSKWISVQDRLPDLIPCDAGTAYSEAVLVWTSGEKAMVAIWDGSDFMCAAGYWEAWAEVVTHWTPLPEPPKEG